MITLDAAVELVWDKDLSAGTRDCVGRLRSVLFLQAATNLRTFCGLIRRTASCLNVSANAACLDRFHTSSFVYR